MDCPYCNNTAQWVENKAVYGDNIGKSYMVWLCQPCDAYVGCHNNSKEPLGIIADKITREWRQKAHKAFDPLWKSGNMSRSEAYKKLNACFNQEIHIGQAGEVTCKRIISFVKDFKRAEDEASKASSEWEIKSEDQTYFRKIYHTPVYGKTVMRWKCVDADFNSLKQSNQRLRKALREVSECVNIGDARHIAKNHVSKEAKS